MSTPKEISILSKWLEKRLKEHFTRMLKRTNLAQQEDFYWKYSSFSHKNKEAPIEATVFDFRILELKLDKESPRQCYYDGIFDKDNDSDENLGTDTPDYEQYKQVNSHVYLIYQRGSQCVGKELHLFMYASQVENMNMDDNDNGAISKYVISLDEHQIDVYTRVFPLLQDWALSHQVKVNFCVPECYYGCYQTETRKDAVRGIPDKYVFLDKDDIMSKAAAGMDFFEMERRNSETSSRKKQSSYRLLILEDIARLEFKTRVVSNSTFLSLLNVEEALKALAEIHSVSWTFSAITGDPLEKVWPFLNNPSYLPYVGESVMRGFPVMVGMVRDYLLRRETEENEVKGILQAMIKLKTRLMQVLEGSRHPRTVKCLIHQDACGARFLFRYSLLDSPKKKKEKQNGNCGINESALLKKPKASFPTQSLKDDCETKARRDCLEKGLRREVMIINWQTASVGSPMLDVAFLLMTALPPKIRRVETLSLLKIYWNTFRMHASKFGVTLEYSDKELYEDYLEALLYTCVLVTGNIDSQVLYQLDDEGTEVFVEAIKDLMHAELI